jgi:N-acetylmuramoyl-L-alanine amidase
VITRPGEVRLLLFALAVTVHLGAPAQTAHAQTHRQPLVVIDAGHGGVDPGAIGPGGTHEKEVALAVARELAHRLEAVGGYDVRLTRRSDILVPLSERTAMANRWREESGPDRPAIFISVHANAHSHRSVRGIETYFLSEALTEDARRVAERENAARRFEPHALADPLRFILDDLRQNHYLHESSDAATIFQQRLDAIHPGPDRGVKQAGFVVLEGAFMPAVLVEIGFISNPQEEALLASVAFQRRVAMQLADSVEAFFARSSRGNLSSIR